MSKLRTAAVALTTALALGTGTTLVSAAPAHANPCTSTPTVYCSMYWAGFVTTSATYGTSGSEVTALQKSIQQLQLGIKVTNTFDDQTRAYVLQYQRSRGLAQNGTVDTATLAALRSGAGSVIATGSSLGGKVPLKTVPRAVAKPLPTTSPTTTTQAVSKADVAVKFAYAQLGKPYVYGATGPSSYDCSGLTGAAWKAAGVSVPRTSYQQLGSLKKVSKSELRPGDIVGFYTGGHVGLYVGDGYVIHASRPGTPVNKAKMSTMPYYYSVRPAA
ncbi:C40 family peptidase [Propionibacteriaceae bacterium G1746]|uniref:C40 family peptidase n=1 Tax=Aestuariimicrobium sp. G57 TaxID=3418485 RepID=UPI003C1F2630